MNLASTTSTGLAARLKEDTRTLHTLAERSGIMADLLRGRLSLPTYLALLRNLQAIYAALEAGLDRHASDAHVQRLWRPELRRLPALARDIESLQGQAPPAAAPLTAATGRYVQRLQALAADEPLLLLAHAYLRYLGDLHGGQMLARIVRQQFGLDGSTGTAFYDFGDAATVEQLKRDFRTGLDALALTPLEVDAVVAEACDAFELHQALFEQLAPAAA